MVHDRGQRTPLSDTSGLGGDSKPSKNPNSFYPNLPSQSDKSAPAQSVPEEDSGVKNKKPAEQLSNSDTDLRNENDQKSTDRTEEEPAQEQQKTISFDPLFDRSPMKLKRLAMPFPLLR